MNKYKCDIMNYSKTIILRNQKPQLNKQEFRSPVDPREEAPGKCRTSLVSQWRDNSSH